MHFAGVHCSAFVPCGLPWASRSEGTTFKTKLPVGRRRTIGVNVRCCLKQGSSTEVAHMLDGIRTIAGDARGIFGHDDNDRMAIEESIRKAESTNKVGDTTADNARKAHGKWRLLYTTLEILGNRRIRLGLSTPRKPGLVTLGEIVQTVDADKSQTSNIVRFSAFGGIEGTFSIVADYEVESEKRVRVKSRSAKLEPEKLNKLLGKKVSLLTQIFNPEGTLDITYIDDTVRVGRDGKGRVFVVERLEE